MSWKLYITTTKKNEVVASITISILMWPQLPIDSHLYHEIVVSKI